MGSSGLIGSEVAAHFDAAGWAVHGVDNTKRAVFFGPAGDTRWNRHRVASSLKCFTHHELDIRDREGVGKRLAAIQPDAIVHTAAQPWHGRAADIPFDDFDTNAAGTLNLLEAPRPFAPEAPFVHMSTNKVYSDAPNDLSLLELATRWAYADPAYAHGIPDTFRDRREQALPVRGLKGVCGRDGVGIRPLLWDGLLLLQGRMSHRPIPLGRGVARVPALPCEVQFGGSSGILVAG
jgi:hypothetical protein